MNHAPRATQVQLARDQHVRGAMLEGWGAQGVLLLVRASGERVLDGLGGGGGEGASPPSAACSGHSA